MSNAITDNSSTPSTSFWDDILKSLNSIIGNATSVLSDNIKVNVNNPVIDLSNSPYIKYGIIGILVVVVYFLFFNKKTAIT